MKKINISIIPIVTLTITILSNTSTALAQQTNVQKQINDKNLPLLKQCFSYAESKNVLSTLELD